MTDQMSDMEYVCNADRVEERRHSVAPGAFEVLETDPAQVIPELCALATFAPEFALPYYWLGQWHLLEKHDVDRAREAFERAIEGEEYLYEDREAKCYWWLGNCCVASADSDQEKALNCYEKALELGWDSAYTYFAMNACLNRVAEQQLIEGEDAVPFSHTLERMVEVLTEATEKHPDDDELARFLKDTQAMLGDLQQQAQELGEEKMFPQFRADLIVRRAKALSDDDRDQEAVDLLRKLLQDQPDHKEGNRWLAQCYVYSGQPRKGFQQFHKYLELSSLDDFYLSRLTVLPIVSLWLPLIDQKLDSLIAMRNYGEAMALLSDWETLFFPPEPPDGEVRQQPAGVLTRFGAMLNNIGVRYGKVAQASDSLRSHNKSLSCLQRAAVLFSDLTSLENLPIAHRNLAVYYRERGEPVRAIEHLQKAVDINPQYGDGWWELSIAFLDINEMETSLQCLMRAGALGDPDAIAMIRQLQGG